MDSYDNGGGRARGGDGDEIEVDVSCLVKGSISSFADSII